MILTNGPNPLTRVARCAIHPVTVSDFGLFFILYEFIERVKHGCTEPLRPRLC